jgi:hypothetical protein
LAYVPKWSLADALNSGIELGHTRLEVKRDICAALLSGIRFRATPEGNAGLPRYHLVSFEVPRDLTPRDLDWANSRPKNPWVSTYGHPAPIAKLELFADDVNQALGWNASPSSCTAIITNTPHNTDEACAIVRNLVALVEAQQVDFVAALFRAIWGAEPGRLPYLNRPSFYGEILCCWRPRWIPGTKKSPMQAYAWYVWRKEPRSGPSLKVRVGRRETIAALSAFT